MEFSIVHSSDLNCDNRFSTMYVDQIDFGPNFFGWRYMSFIQLQHQGINVDYTAISWLRFEYRNKLSSIFSFWTTSGLHIEAVDDKNNIAVYKVMWYTWYNYNMELYVKNTAVLWYKIKKG